MLTQELELRSLQRTVTAAGTKERLREPATSQRFFTKTLIVKALTSNAGKIYISSDDVSSTTGLDLDAGDIVVYELSDREWESGRQINLATIWIDADNNGEGVTIQYERI